VVDKTTSSLKKLTLSGGKLSITGRHSRQDFPEEALKM
jgi:hypothetical protein